MNRRRVSGLVVVVCLVCAAPAFAQLCTPQSAVTITLTTTQPALGKEVHPGCWMPQVDQATKDTARLCGHDITQAHSFTFTLRNECPVDVGLRLTLRGGGSIDFDTAGCRAEGTGPRELFDDFLAANGGSSVHTCTTKPHPSGTGRRKTMYDLVARRVRVNGQEQPIAPPVDYDPEIVLEDRGAGGHHALWYAAGLLALAALGYWLYGRLTRKQAA